MMFWIRPDSKNSIKRDVKTSFRDSLYIGQIFVYKYYSYYDVTVQNVSHNATSTLH